MPQVESTAPPTRLCWCIIIFHAQLAATPIYFTSLSYSSSLVSYSLSLSAIYFTKESCPVSFFALHLRQMQFVIINLRQFRQRQSDFRVRVQKGKKFALAKLEKLQRLLLHFSIHIYTFVEGIFNLTRSL